MPYYAQINEQNICTSVTETAGEIQANNLIKLENYDTELLGRPYDLATKTWGALPPLPPPEWEWYIDVGPFFDRFGATKMAVLASTDPGLRSILTDLQVRKWIDLRRTDVIQGLQYVSSVVPSVTAEVRDRILNTAVQPVENLALRRMFFS